uniref:Cleavage/polyadenylation specificity factor, 25kDa subunit n=1 Tax=Tanacetum cinerariifolium TaxID=118510 RepID=A0A6L2LLG2_TANCI|nr:cleavage/polyadenylation specificity factor, 25kDa subunit [Tanacetum cinerariifolium]
MVGSWNIGSLTRKLFELVDALGRHKVDITCFQETKWKGSRAKEGNGYKLWYSGSSTARNSVGIILTVRLKDNVVRVTRRSDRIMAISVLIEGETVNVISAYAPQVGLSDADKKRFWDALDKMARECPTDQQLIIGGDLNGHIGVAADGYARVHGGFRAFPGEACSSQHRLIIVDVLLERLQHRRDVFGRTRIWWKNLNGEAVETFRAIVSEKLVMEDMSASNADQMWNTLACVMKDAAKDSLGLANETARTHSTHMKSWWFCEEVQTKVAAKYKAAKREARIAMAKAKDKAYKDLYKKFNSKEGVNDIYKIAKARERRRRDIGNKMGRNKAVCLDQIPIEAWRCLEDEGVKWLTCLFNKIFSSVKMPNEWRLSEVIPIYKNRGDAQECSNYRGIKLLIHTMKLWERVIERRLRRETRVLENQFDFMPGRSTTERAASGVLCDRRIPLNLKGKFYRVAIRPAMLYGSECWPIMKALSNNVEVAELRMLRWTCGKTMVDMIPNGILRAELDVDSIIDKMREGRLRSFRHVKRRPQTALVKRVEALIFEGSGRRGRPKLRWEDRLKMDMKELRLPEDMTFDRDA